MSNTLEDRIRDIIISNENQLFGIRNEAVKYHGLDGKPDPRYTIKISELLGQEEALTQRITRLAVALEKAASIGVQYPGCNRNNPLSFLQDKSKMLEKGLAILQSDILSLKRKIEENANVSRRPDIVTRSGKLNHAYNPVDDCRQQIKEKELQLPLLSLEIEKVKKLISKIEPILQGASS